MNKINCSKCNGSGKLSHYSHIANGDCFQCEGKGFKLLTDKQLAEYKTEQEEINQRYKEAEENERQYELKLKQQQEAAEQRKQDNIEKFQETLSHYGKIGQKVKLTLKEKFIKDTRYGRMYVLENDQKQQFTFYSKEYYFCKDNMYEITGTIKEHAEYNGYKQTVLKSVKVLNHIDTSELEDEELEELLGYL